MQTNTILQSPTSPTQITFFPYRKPLTKLKIPLPKIGSNLFNTTKNLDFHRFVVKKDVFQKKSSSLSPKNRSPKKQHPIKEDNFDFSRLRTIREKTLESEIKVEHLYNKLLETKTLRNNQTPNQCLEICFEMLENVFLSNEKTTSQLKEISNFFHEAIYCEETLAKKLEKALGERMKIKGEEYRIVLTRLLEKINETKCDNEKKMEKYELELKNLNEKVVDREEMIKVLNQKIKESDEKFRNEEHKIVEKLKKEIRRVENELSLKESETKNMRTRLEKRMNEIETHEAMLKVTKEQEIASIIKEKDDIIASKVAQVQGFENIKVWYEKLIVNHRTLLASSKFLKERISHYESQISALMNENQTLKIRAGVAWDEMTPRPSLSQLTDFLKVDQEQLKNKSTRNQMEELSELIISRIQSYQANRIAIKSRKHKTIKSSKNIESEHHEHISSEHHEHNSRKSSRALELVSENKIIHKNSKKNTFKIAFLEPNFDGNYGTLQTPEITPKKGLGFAMDSFANLESSWIAKSEEDLPLENNQKKRNASRHQTLHQQKNKFMGFI